MANTSTNETLNKLQDLYLNQKFDDFINLLLKEKASFPLGQFHYNLGTAYLKIENIGAARFHLEKSIWAGYSKSGALKNINLVKTNVIGVQAESSQDFYDFFWRSSKEIPSEAYMTLSLMIILAGIVGVALKKIKKVPGVVLILAVACIPVLFSSIFVKKLNYAVSLVDAEIREGPSKIFEVSRPLPAGLKVLVEQPKDGWYYIKSPVDLAGWVRSKDLGVY
ncbi:MAG: SH3 domain-containing protein [Bacteriovoracaceae bacterium]|jgi:hypothetical protein|nr:SH3 domain-containing protein [Bacteriovoracaceae bacterium]